MHFKTLTIREHDSTLSRRVKDRGQIQHSVLLSEAEVPVPWDWAVRHNDPTRQPYHAFLPLWIMFLCPLNIMQIYALAQLWTKWPETVWKLLVENNFSVYPDIFPARA